MKKTIQKAVLASCIAPCLLASGTAMADLSASFSASNMYLWRGINISDPAPAISGSLDYSHASGFYAGIWGSSEGAFDDSNEYDLYLGFAGEAGGLSYDVGYVSYLYPNIESGSAGVTDLNGLPGDVDFNEYDFADVYVALGYGSFSASAFIGASDGSEDVLYYTLGYAFDKIDFTYGSQNFDGDEQWSHLTVGYAANDEISFALNFSSSGDVEINEDPLFVVTYSKGWDL